MKRKLLWLIALGLVLFLIPLAVNAEIVDSGECGNGVTWTLDDEGLLTISGNGYMTSNPWTANMIRKVSIKSGVLNIHDGAFMRHYSLTEVDIEGNDILSIGDNAFGYCSMLTVFCRTFLEVIAKRFWRLLQNTLDAS